jgi:tetratricopeptide (TPR) repeat protein
MAMDPTLNLTQLESAREWQSLAEALEAAIERADDANEKSALFLRLGRVMTDKLLQAPRALRYFQNAWKLQPENVQPLKEARDIYWDLGKLKMVETVLKRSLESAPKQHRAELLVELGDVSADLGNFDAALESYAAAAQESGPFAKEAAIKRDDFALDAAAGRERIDDLVGNAADSNDRVARVGLLLRAGRLAKRHGLDSYEELLLAAYQADCDNKQASALYEELMVSQGRLAQVLETQREMLESASAEEGPRLAFRYGVRWATRHQNVELGARLLEQAVLGDPSNDAAFTFLRELWGTHGGDWQRVMALAEQIAEVGTPPPFVLAEGGRLSWLRIGDLMKARRWFERLAGVEPEHPQLKAFEAQIGERLSGGVAMSGVVDVRSVAPADDANGDVELEAPTVPPEDRASSTVEVAEEPESIPPPPVIESSPPPPSDGDVRAAARDRVSEPEEAPVSGGPVSEAPPVSAPARTASAAPVAAAPAPKPAPAPPVPQGPQDDKLIAELLAEADKQKQAKRNHDYVKTLVRLAEAHTEPSDKVPYYAEAAQVYEKFSNASEAAKCYEAILAVDATHTEAKEFLRGYYDKRRDYESLISLLRREADSILDGDERLAKLIEIAKLATERVKKPQLCVDLWQAVREQDPQNEEALSALANFHERAREWEQLADVLTEQVAATADEGERLKMLEKLAQIQGDRLKNEEAAADAWRQVLEINPQDRRAQENLKKKLLALKAWDDLELLYEESAKWDEFIRLLESQESREKEVETKVSMLLKVADLWETKKNQTDRAARAYEKILKIDEKHLAAAEALIPIYQEAGNAKGLAEAIEVKLLHVTEGDGADPDQALTLLQQVAGLYETKLRKPDLALERYLRAMELAPDNAQCAEDAERAAAGTKAWDKLVDAYRAALGGVADPEAEGVLRLRLGRVLLDEVGQVDGALEQYRAVYELDPDNNDALAALERLYRQTGRYAELLEVYQKQRDLATEPDQQCRVLYGIAVLYEGELKDPKSAIATYWAVLDVEPADERALGALDRLYLAQQEWEPYANVLRRRLEIDVPEATLIDLKYRLGQTLEKHLGDAAGALENYREILFVDPGNDNARVALEGLVSVPEISAEVAGILVEVYEGREEWDKLIGALEILVGAEQDFAARVTLLRKIAGVAADQLGDHDRAFAAQARALAEAPENAEVRLELEDFAERGKAQQRLAEVFAGVAAGLTDPVLAREYWMRLAHIQRGLGQVVEAAGSYQHVLEIDPADNEALDSMEGLLADHKRWEDLIGVIRRRIDLSDDPAARERLYANMANIFDAELGKPEEAIAAYNEVLGFDAASQRALGALDNLYSRQGMHAELAENLEQQLRLCESEEQEMGLMLRLARLQETDLGQKEAAIETYRQVLERQMQNASAIAALERLGNEPEHEVEIADILGPLYRNIGDHQKLLGIFEVQIRRADDPARAVELLHEMAELHEDAAGNLDAAFDTLARALELDPGAQVTQEGLERLANATDRFADLARVYESLAARISQDEGADLELAIALYTISATIYERQLGALDNAIAHYRRILQLEPSHLDAVEALERIFRGADRYEELSQVLQLRAQLLHDVEHQKRALMQAAQIEEEVLERVDTAVAVYQKVLEIDAEDLAALDALIKLFMGMARWPALLEIYNRKVDLVFDSEERKRIYYQMGAVYEGELGEVRKAIDTYQRVLEIDPDDLTALGRLDVLFQQAEDWPELLTVLQREADLAGDREESISYQYRIAALYDARLNDVQRAIELYRDLLTQQSDHEPTLTALDALTRGERAPLEAAQVLEPIYDALGEWDKLIEVLEVQGRATEDAYHRIELLHRIGRLYESMLNNPGAAFDTFARAVAVDVTNEESLGNFERLASMVSRWGDLATLYDRQLAALTEDPARHAEIGLRLARIYEEQLEDYAKAIERYQLVLQTDPENHHAIVALDRLFEHTERFPELAAILRKESELAQDAEAILGFKFRLAQVHQYRLNDIQGAIGAYGEVISEMPEHQGALQALEGLFAQGTEQLRVAEILEPHYESLSQFAELAAVYEAVLAHRTERADRLAQYYRLAELHEERILAADAALAVFIRALQECPDDERTLEDVERLAALVEDGWEHLANAYADVLGRHESQEVQRAVGKRLARVFEEELDDVEKAEETYRYVLSNAALDIVCLENLDRIYTAMEQHAELAQVLEQRVQTTEEPFALVELYTRLGDTYETQLGQLDDAVRAYRKIFDQLDPENEQAQIVLERIYRQQEKWQELYGVYERQLATAPGEHEKADISAKMARVLADYLGDPPRAIDTWKKVLELRGGEDGEAFSGLSDLYERTEQWAELTEVLERHMGLVYDDREQVAVLLRRARLYLTQLGRDDAALEDYTRVLDIDYANFEALYAITDIWRKRGDNQELLYALHQTIDRAGSALPAENLVALYREAATIHQQTDQRFEAIDAWRKLLEVDPRDFAAMAHLEELLRAEERWEEVVDVKMMRARAFDEPAEQIREFLEVAHIWEHQVGNEDGATPALEAVMQLDAHHDEGFDQLEKLHRAAHRWETLIDMYLTRIEIREDIHERTRLLRKVARVFDEQLHDQVQAYDALQTAFELDFNDEETVVYLEKMAAATRSWPQLIQLVTTWLEQAEEARAKIALYLRLAKWYGEDLDRQDYAHAYHAKVLELDPNNVVVLRQMANFYKKNARWREQGQMLEKALAVASKEADRSAILTDMGEVLEAHVDPEQGLASYKRALEADPYYLPALDALERIYEQREMITELVAILDAKSKSLEAEQPDRSAEVKLRMGGLIESVLSNPERAIDVYRAVLDVQAGNLLAIKGLERVYQVTEKWPELLEVLEMHLDVVKTERERAEVLLAIADLQEKQFFKAELAAQRLEQVVEIDPTSEQAYEMLARCYHRLRQWLDLIGCLERHIGATDNREKKIELFTQIAETYADQVEDQERALDAYLNIIDIEPNHVPALEALARLYERMENPSSAIDYMTRVAELTVDGTQRVEAFYRIGKQLEDKLGDRHQARERFEQALDLDPAHTPTLSALRAIAIDEGDWDMAARYLDMEQQNTETPRARAKLLVELGRLRAEMLDEKDAAVEAYQLAHQADGDNEDAALPLARHYAAEGHWEHAQPLSEMLVARAGKREREEQLELYMLHGKIESQLGRFQESLRAYTNAHKLDLTNQAAIRGLADVNFSLGDWAGALTNYQKVLTSLGDDDVEQRADVYYRLGCVKREQAQLKQAINNFEKGLALDPAHRPTLEALVAVYEGQQDWTQACAYRSQILENIIDGDERFQLLNDLADIWADRVGDSLKALTALESAAELRPDDHQLQHKMLHHYQKTDQWDRMVDVLAKIAEADPKPERRARYLFTMAQVYRDKLNDPYHSAELFDEALDLNPDYIDAFKRIDKVYTSLKDWGKLERAYRKMIHRIVGKGRQDLEYNLWHALGLIYRDRLNDPTKAADAFTAATALRPDQAEDHLILAELAEQQGRYDDALGSFRQLLKRDAMNVDAYRAMYNVFLTQQSYDRAWCVASVLSFLGRANEEEQRFFEDWRPSDIPKPTSRLDGETWIKYLFHEEEDLYISKIFEAVVQAALRAKVDALKAKNELPNLPEQFRQDPQTSTVNFARTFWWAAEILGIRAPNLYARADVPGALTAVPADPPASVAGNQVLQGLGTLDRAFVSGSHLTMYRSEHYIKMLFPTVTELTVLLFAAIRIVAPQAPAPPEYNAQVQATAVMLNKYLQPMQREQLKVIVSRFLKEGARANLKRWAQCVETTAARAGLLLAGDLDVAKRVIASQPQLPGDLTPQERLKELMVFSVSDNYFTLRSQLGLQINPEGAA